MPISEEHKTLDGHDLDKYVDENTIGVVAIMGVTYTGMYEPVAEIAAALDEIQAEHRPRHPDPRRRRVRRHDRAVPAARPRVGLPRRAGALDQHLGPQVRPRLPGSRLGGLAHARRTCPRTWSSTSATSAATCRRSRSTSPARARRCCCSTTCSCGSGCEGTARCSRRRRTSRSYLADEIAKHRRVRAVERRQRHPRLRLAAQAGPHRQLEPLPPVGPAAHEGLAGAGLPDARRPRRPHGAAHRGAQRSEHRPGRQAARRASRRDRVPRRVSTAPMPSRGPELRVPPLRPTMTDTSKRTMPGAAATASPATRHAPRCWPARDPDGRRGRQPAQPAGDVDLRARQRSRCT